MICPDTGPIEDEYLHIFNTGHGNAGRLRGNRKGLDRKQQRKGGNTFFSHHKYMGVIFRRSATDNSILMVESDRNSLGVMHVPKAHKFNMDQINSNQD